MQKSKIQFKIKKERVEKKLDRDGQFGRQCSLEPKSYVQICPK